MITAQVKSFIPHLKVDGFYLFSHRTKGPFVARFIGMVPTLDEPNEDGDKLDDEYIRCDVYTGDGSGSERLANAFMRSEDGGKRRPEYSEKLIRPSKLETITSPDKARQIDLIAQFTAIREAAPTVDGNLVLPALSIPTAQAMERFSDRPPVLTQVRHHAKLIGIGAGLAVAGAAAAAIVDRLF